MIVHVWSGRCERRIGPVAVAADADGIAGGARRSAATGGADPRRTTPPAPTASSRRSASSIPTAATTSSSTCRATCRPSIRSRSPPCSARSATRDVDIATLAAEIAREDERTNPNVVKVVGVAGRAAGACARSISPAPPRPAGEGPLYHHIGIYAYRRAALERFVALPPCALEKREKLEQLRALEAGMRIDVAIVDEVPLGVDTPDDLERRARRARRATHEQGRSCAKTRRRSRASRAPIPHIACREVFPDCEPVPCADLRGLLRRRSRRARPTSRMIPIENSLAGRVADIHHLLPNSGFHIIGEHFLPVHHQLLAREGRDARRR